MCGPRANWNKSVAGSTVGVTIHRPDNLAERVPKAGKEQAFRLSTKAAPVRVPKAGKEQAFRLSTKAAGGSVA